MDASTLVDGRLVVDGGAHVWMTKRDVCAELEQSQRLRLAGSTGVDAELRRGPPQQRRITFGLGRRDEEQAPRLHGKSLERRPRGVGERIDRGQRGGQTEASCEPLGRPAVGQPEEQARVALRFGDDAVADPRVERAGNDRGEQRLRLGVGEAMEDQFGQSLELLDRLAQGKHQRGGLGPEPARDERQHLSRWPIEPVGIVDGAHERLVGTDLGEQAEDGQPHQESVDLAALAHAEGGGERIALRSRQAGHTIQHRRAQAMQPGEGQVQFRLHAADLGNPEPRCRCGVPQQRRLPEPCFPAHHQRPTPPGPCGPEQTFERLALSHERERAIRSQGEIRPERSGDRVNADAWRAALRVVEQGGAVDGTGLELAAVTCLHRSTLQRGVGHLFGRVAPGGSGVFGGSRQCGPQPVQLVVFRLASMRLGGGGAILGGVRVRIGEHGVALFDR